MKIPKTIRKNNRKYIFVKRYPNFILYKDIITGTRRCFSPYDLGIIKENIKPPKCDLNVEKVKL